MVAHEFLRSVAGRLIVPTHQVPDLHRAMHRSSSLLAGQNSLVERFFLSFLGNERFKFCNFLRMRGIICQILTFKRI
jgi:hypothetical protein